jgi:hypothetical protein
VARALEALCGREPVLAEHLPGVTAGDPSACRRLAWTLDQQELGTDLIGSSLFLAWTAPAAAMPGVPSEAVAAHRLAALLECWRVATRALHYATDTGDWATFDRDSVSNAMRTVAAKELQRSLRGAVVALRRAIEETMECYSWQTLVQRLSDTLLKTLPSRDKAKSGGATVEQQASDVAPQGPSAVVAPSLKVNVRDGRTDRLKPLASPLPLAVMPTAGEVTRRLAALTNEAPNMAAVFGRARQDLALRRASGQLTLQLLRPVLIVGPPGTGKSRAAVRLAEVLCWPFASLEMSTADDHRIGGTGRTWSGSHPAWPVEAIADLRYANPLLILDELGRGQAHAGGRAEEALHGMIESHTASRFSDPVVGTVDLSLCSWIATANPDAIRKVPPSVLSRFRVIEIEALPMRSFGVVLDSVLDDLARRHGFIRREFLPRIEPEERSFLEAKWRASGGNARLIAKLTERVLGAAAEREAGGKPN